MRPARAFPTLSGERTPAEREPKDGLSDDVGLSLRLCGHVDSRAVVGDHCGPLRFSCPSRNQGLGRNRFRGRAM